VTDDEAKQRFAAERVARLATVDAAGGAPRPHLVPICFALDEAGDVLFSAVDAKPKSTPDLKRLRNISAHPHVTVLVDHYEDDWEKVWWVRLDGVAEVHEPSEPDHATGLALLAEKYEQYRDAPDLLGRMVVVRANRWTAWAYRDFG
jgi:PPOX class probable F420-dependent enzyme